MKNRAKQVLISAGLFGMVAGSAVSTAYARSVEDCALAWGQAVRSYLTQNRTKGPDDETFKAACEMESSDKSRARVEAVLIGTKALAKLDPRGCAKFLESYVEANGPAKLCDAALKGTDDGTLRKMIGDSLPPAPAGGGGGKKRK
jgi:hypothetical protein